MADKLNWTTQYSVTSCSTKIGRIEIYWKDGCYNIKVFGVSLKKTFSELKIAQMYAVKVSKMFLTDVIQQLDDIEGY